MTETLRETFRLREVQYVAKMAEPERAEYLTEYARSPLHTAEDTQRMRDDVAAAVERAKVGS